MAYTEYTDIENKAITTIITITCYYFFYKFGYVLFFRLYNMLLSIRGTVLDDCEYSANQQMCGL